MNLTQIPQKSVVMIDANIFVYASQRSSKQCVTLLERCAKKEIHGVLSTHILAEVMHVLMLAEARDIGVISGAHPAKSLGEHPRKVQSLSRYESLIRDLLAIGLRLEPLRQEDFLTAFSLQRQYGLLTNDALFIASAERLRIESVASADTLFNGIKSITLFSPNDIHD